jgi:hypothetical protein
MLGSRRWRRLHERTLNVRDHCALCRSWLVEGLMYETVQEKKHDEHPSGEEL